MLPDSLKSPALTSEWENKLMQVQKGEKSENEFMGEIKSFITAIVKDNAKPKEEYIKLFQNDKPSIGKCPRCNSTVREADKGYLAN